MTAREVKEIVAEIKAFTKQLASEPPEKSKELLIKAGICTPDGKLTKAYKRNV